MTDSSSPADPVGKLAEEFMERYRRGERPALSEYTERYPALAGRIRDLFPMLVVMEEADSGTSSHGDAADTHACRKSRDGERPDRIAGYRILREVGRGGMGVVYEAEQLSLGRHVALKVLPDPLAHDPRGLERFRREARAAARLHHTNIVPVHEVGQDGGVAFYAMQFIRGQPLDAVLGELKALRSRSDDPGSAGAPESVGEAADVALSLLTGRFELGTTAGPGGASEPPATVSLTSSAVRSSAVLPGQSEHSAAETGCRHYHRSVAHVGVQVAEALSYAHREGVIHRDIKPSNLLIDADSRVWITDFGLAKSDGEALTQTGDIVGTIRYMAPERFRGWSDPRSDVYSLGLTLYEMLLLRPAFEAGDRVELIRRVTHDEPTPLRKADPTIPRDLETIVHKSIDKEPSRRYGSSDELAADLRRFLVGEPIQARSVGPLERAWIWSKRRPAVASLLVSLALVFLSGFTATSLLWARAERSAATARFNEAKAERERQNAQARAEELRRQDYVSRISLAYREFLADNPSRALELLEGCPKDLRGWEWEYVARECHRELHTFRETSPYSVGTVAYSPDGRRIASGSKGSPYVLNVFRPGDRGDLVVREIATGREVFAKRDIAQGVRSVAFSPDGRWLAVGNDLGLVVHDAATGAERFREDLPGFPVIGVAYSPDGRWILTGHGEFMWSGVLGHAKLWDATTGVALADLKPEVPKPIHCVAFSADSRQVALTWGEDVQLWDLEAGESIRVRRAKSLRGHTGKLVTVAFSPDGRYLASGGFDQTIKLWDRDSGNLVRNYFGHDGTVRGLAFSPDGRRLVSAGDDKRIKLWSVDSGRELTTIHGHDGLVECVAFSPDGYQIASGSSDHTLKIWFATRNSQVTYRGHGAWVSAVAFRPEGLAVATGATFNASGDFLHLWDPATGELIQAFPERTDYSANISFSPDGLLLAASNWDLAPGSGVRVLDVASGRTRLVLEASRGVTFSPDGKTLATEGPRHSVSLRDSRTGIELKPSFLGHTAGISGLAFSRDGRYLASAGQDKTVRVWEVGSGRVRLVGRHEGGVQAVAFSPDGKWLVSAGGVQTHGELYIWDLSSGLKRSLHGHSHAVTAVAFSPTDHRRLVTASNDRTVRLWDWEAGQELLTLQGHTNGVVCVAFSPDGRRIISGSYDGTAKVWDSSTPDAGVIYRREAVAEGAEGDAALKAGRWDEAAAAFDMASRFQPGSPRFPLGRGRALARLGRFGEAEADFAQAIALASHDPQLLARIGSDCAELGLKDSANLAFTRAAILKPDDPRHQIAIARHQAELGLRDAAEATLTRAATIAPDDPRIQVELGRAYDQLGRLEQANARFAQAATLAPNDPRIQIAIGRGHAELGRWKEADARFEQAAALARDDPGVFLDAGWWVVGPYPMDLSASFPPEFAPDPSRPVAMDSGATPDGRATLRWRSIPPEDQGRVDFLKALRPAPCDVGSAYGLAYVYVREERDAVLSLAFDEAEARVWINGQVVYEETKYPSDPGRAEKRVRLRKGRNTLLARVINSWGCFEMQARFVGGSSDPGPHAPAK